MQKSDTFESLFSVAVAMDQSGRQKNTIHIHKDTIFIANTDKTIILRFRVQFDMAPNPVSFNASDYEGNTWEVEDDSISFLTKESGWKKKKRCPMPALRFDRVKEIWNSFNDKGEIPSIQFFTQSATLLNQELSHIEFMAKDKKIHIVQRDIYSGNIIELVRETTGLGLNVSGDKITRDFPPIGMRTNDFLTLLAFQDKIRLSFPGMDYFYAEGEKFHMKAIVGSCLYDKIGTINEEVDYGWKESEKRISELQANRKDSQIGSAGPGTSSVRSEKAPIRKRIAVGVPDEETKPKRRGLII